MRYLLIDRITELRPPELATAVKCVSLSDDFFVDHFPGFPVMPGALILESLAQLGGVLIEAIMRERGRDDLHALLTIVERAKFRHMVRPGDRMELQARGIATTEDGGKVHVTARVDDNRACEATLIYAFAHVTHPEIIARRREVLNIWLHGMAFPPA
jgi:3-hydroxymyristoyl/3-hydroxydecanoyl-(acyl carrier protein) dehydratase